MRTAQVLRTILAAAETGAPLKSCCAVARISYETLREWILDNPEMAINWHRPGEGVSGRFAHFAGRWQEGLARSRGVLAVGVPEKTIRLAQISCWTQQDHSQARSSLTVHCLTSSAMRMMNAWRVPTGKREQEMSVLPP